MDILSPYSPPKMLLNDFPKEEEEEYCSIEPLFICRQISSETVYVDIDFEATNALREVIQNSNEVVDIISVKKIKKTESKWSLIRYIRYLFRLIKH